MKVKKITTIGILCALAMIVNMFAFMPLVPTVTWLTYDPKDIIIVIGGFIYGPMTSLIMSGICSVLEIMIKGGTILDVFMNMISTCSFACVAAAVYKHKHTKQGAMIGLLLGVVITVINYDDLELYCHTNLLWYASSSSCSIVVTWYYSI